MTKDDREFIARLKKSAETSSRISREMAEAKSLRQGDCNPPRADLYAWTKPEDTLEGQAATRLEALQAQPVGEKWARERAYQIAYGPLRSAQHALNIIAGTSGNLSNTCELAHDESERIEQAIAALDTPAALTASPPVVEEGQREAANEVAARAICKMQGNDPDELTPAATPIGDTAEYPLWMLLLPEARKIVDAAILAATGERETVDAWKGACRDMSMLAADERDRTILLIGLLERAREYVADDLDAHEHSDGRDLLKEIDSILALTPVEGVGVSEERSKFRTIGENWSTAGRLEVPLAMGPRLSDAAKERLRKLEELDAVALIEACKYPMGSRFTYHDEEGEHDPAYVVIPGGEMVPINGYDDGDAPIPTDVARAAFIVTACNVALSTPVAQGDEVRGFVRDFRSRANQCRTNNVAHCPEAASVWDLAADALEGKS